MNIQFDEGDAEGMPYPDGSFDLIVSMYGAMFAPRPERAAALIFESVHAAVP